MPENDILDSCRGSPAPLDGSDWGSALRSR
jgi:hypothetical protein